MKKLTQTGFTLLELIGAVVVVGVVTAIGVPSFKQMMVTNRLADTVNQMRMSMKLARSEAVVRGKDSIMCSSVDGSSCANVDSMWQRGWVVGIDLNGNGQVDEANNELLWVHQIDSDTQLTITPSDPALNQALSYSFNGWVIEGDDIGFDICSGFGVTAGYPRRELRASLAGDPTIFKNVSEKC